MKIFAKRKYLDISKIFAKRKYLDILKIFRRYFEEEKANLITLSFSPINRVEKLSISYKGLERKRV